ncbi:hypothetical protein CPB84DRAFT_1799583 [Gymnopilus junonius]|uniref:Secreted protein n=1 Tax=Gymnopilus junonius TaxID=109634 RepID=A0A9P5NAS8_GYMJU|nr:hypothetical protein CPB84DRAFT_1799583 [Gymnopilus junonius]
MWRRRVYAACILVCMATGTAGYVPHQSVVWGPQDGHFQLHRSKLIWNTYRHLWLRQWILVLKEKLQSRTQKKRKKQGHKWQRRRCSPRTLFRLAKIGLLNLGSDPVAMAYIHYS